ncbi:MAG TPA: sortase [Pseudonocardiaceae bacterium]|nr:sortase [Pseudonocardiaceae bacterium]
MHCRTKVALTVAVALVLGGTGCGTSESSSGPETMIVAAAVPVPDSPAVPPDTAVFPDSPALPPDSPALPPDTPALPLDAPALPPDTPALPPDAPGLPSDAPVQPPDGPALPPDPAALPHEFVAPAAPTHFEISGSAFDIKAKVCQMNYVRPLNPPGDQKHSVCWVRKGFGVAPGSDSGGTSYILGHAWAKSPLIFNPLSELAMQEVTGHNPEMQSGVPTFPVKAINGYNIVLRTPTGTLTYTVTRAFAVSKSRAGDVKSLMANTPNRVVLITCGVKDGVDVDYNIIVDAYLTSSTAR